MSSQIDLFFKTINNIQDEVINVALINKDKYDNLEEIITDVTYKINGDGSFVRYCCLYIK